MASRLHSLGSLELYSAPWGLSLQVTSTARFAQSEEDEDIDVIAGLTSDLLTGGSSHQQWIRKDRNYRFELVISSGDDGMVDEVESLTQDVATRLSESKMWSCLGLDASSLEISPAKADGSQRITVSLDHALALEQGAPLLHTINKGVPFYDLKPPNRVRCRQVDVVAVDMVLSESRSSKRRTLSCNGSPVWKQARNTLSPHQMVSHAGEAPLDGLECEDESDEMVFQHDEYRALGAAFHEDQFSLALHCPEREAARTRVVASCASYPTPPASQETGEQITHEPQDDCQIECKTSRHPMEVEHLLLMVESGLRLAVVAAPTRLPAVIEVQSKTALQPLAEVMPALWLPDYCRNVSSRSVFLPTISHAIASVTRYCSPEKSLKAKVHELVRQQGSGDSKASESTASPSTKTQEVLSMALWRTIASSLHDMRSARRLKPMSPFVNADRHIPTDYDGRSHRVLKLDPTHKHYDLDSLDGDDLPPNDFGGDIGNESDGGLDDILSDLGGSDCDDLLLDVGSDLQSDRASVMSNGSNLCSASSGDDSLL